MEKAWLLNSARDLTAENHMDQPLSNWNEVVANGKLPAVVMNATIAETGERFVTASTKLASLTRDSRLTTLPEFLRKVLHDAAS